MKEEITDFEDVLEQIGRLTVKQQQAAAWMLGNIELLDRLCEGEKMAEEQIIELKKKALENNDYIMLIMILYKAEKDRLDNEL